VRCVHRSYRTVGAAGRIWLLPASTGITGDLATPRRSGKNRRGLIPSPQTEEEYVVSIQKSVLVTGGSGFIAGHIILQLLDAGYTVRTTVRSLERETNVRAVLVEAGMKRGDALAFVEADLTSDTGWATAVKGIDYVLHVASPIHTENVKDENQVIGPARDGALRVLRAARDAGVSRVVLTSAFRAPSGTGGAS